MATKKKDYVKKGDKCTADPSHSMVGEVLQVYKRTTIDVAKVKWSSGSIGTHTITTLRKYVEPKKLFVVRLYDGFDNEWMDVSSAVSKEEADRIWNEKTKNGTEKTCYNHIDYYKIFPADTQML